MYSMLTSFIAPNIRSEASGKAGPDVLAATDRPPSLAQAVSRAICPKRLTRNGLMRPAVNPNLVEVPHLWPEVAEAELPIAASQPSDRDAE
jgi:hypothetical protein